MEPMQFWTKLVKHQNDLRLRLSEAGGILLVASWGMAVLLTKSGRSAELAYVSMVAGLCLALVGWILRGFKTVGPLVTEMDILISTGEIRIGDRSFAVDKIEYLDFLVNSYKGMRGPRMRWRQMILPGTDNKLFFTADGKKHAYAFYLEDGLAMRRMELLFREFYQQGIRFRERNRGGRTFLFSQVMNKEHFEQAKREEGYFL